MSDDIPSEIPFKQELSTEMRCGMFTNAKGEVMIVHDKPIASEIQWVEYCQGSNKIALIHEDGTSQDLGIALDEKSSANLVNGLEIVMAHIDDGKIKAKIKTALIIQDY